MSKLAKNNRFQTIKAIPNLAFNLNLLFNIFHSVFDLLASSFSVKLKNADFLGETLASYYIRLCYFKFVKIYSYISNSEIIKINEKVAKRLNEDKTMPRESAQLVFEEDPFGVLDSGPVFNKAKPGTQSKHSFPILLSKICLKVVLGIALTRNEAAKNAFYQFRIMEFFCKEVDLEFEISQIKERFHKVRNNAIERASRANSPKKAFEERSDDSDSNDINIYKKKKGPLIESKPQKSGESSFVPKLSFNNLSSGGNPLKIGSLISKDVQPQSDSIVQKHTTLDFVDRSALPAKISGIKLNFGKIAQRSKQQQPPQVPAIGNKFNLDFSKLVTKTEKITDEEDQDASVKVQPQKIVPGLLGKQALSEPPKVTMSLNLPSQNMPAFGGQGLSKLNLAGVERGTPVQMPTIDIPNTGSSSSSSESIKIDFDEVEKVRIAKQLQASQETSPGNLGGLGLKIPPIGKLNIPPRENTSVAKEMTEEKIASNHIESDNDSSSSSVVGLMGPSNLNPTGISLGLGKRKLCL